MIRAMSVERDSALTDLQRQLAVDLRAAADPRATVAVVMRFVDDRQALLRRNATPATQHFLTNSADGMQVLATDLEEASRSAWGDLAPHVPQPPRVPSVDDRDLLAHEAADEAREANRLAAARISGEARKRWEEQRRG